MNADDVKYQARIEEHYQTAIKARLECESATQLMSARFPELSIVREQILVEDPYDLPPTKI